MEEVEQVEVNDTQVDASNEVSEVSHESSTGEESSNIKSFSELLSEKLKEQSTEDTTNKKPKEIKEPINIDTKVDGPTDKIPNSQDSSLAPHRFNTEAKTQWASVPETVKVEVNRALKELENGLQTYKNEAEQYSSLKDFCGRARSAGKDPGEIVNRYLGLEDLIIKDPIEGLDTICRNLGYSLHQVAAHVMGQEPDKEKVNYERQIQTLLDKISHIENSHKTLATSYNDRIANETKTSVMKYIEDFRSKNPRFDELQSYIPELLKLPSVNNDLEKAYKMAERLYPAQPDQSQGQGVKTQSPDRVMKKVTVSAHTRAVNGNTNRLNGSSHKSERQSEKKSFSDLLRKRMAENGLMN